MAGKSNSNNWSHVAVAIVETRHVDLSGRWALGLGQVVCGDLLHTTYTIMDLMYSNSNVPMDLMFAISGMTQLCTDVPLSLAHVRIFRERVCLIVCMYPKKYLRTHRHRHTYACLTFRYCMFYHVFLVDPGDCLSPHVEAFVFPASLTQVGWDPISNRG